MKLKRVKGKWYMQSEQGKNLGGPYDSYAEAVERLREAEYLKQQKTEE